MRAKALRDERKLGVSDLSMELISATREPDFLEKYVSLMRRLRVADASKMLSAEPESSVWATGEYINVPMSAMRGRHEAILLSLKHDAMAINNYMTPEHESAVRDYLLWPEKENSKSLFGLAIKLDPCKVDGMQVDYVFKSESDTLCMRFSKSEYVFHLPIVNIFNIAKTYCNDATCEDRDCVDNRATIFEYAAAKLDTEVNTVVALYALLAFILGYGEEYVEIDINHDKESGEPYLILRKGNAECALLENAIIAYHDLLYLDEEEYKHVEYCSGTDSKKRSPAIMSLQRKAHNLPYFKTELHHISSTRMIPKAEKLKRYEEYEGCASYEGNIPIKFMLNMEHFESTRDLKEFIDYFAPDLLDGENPKGQMYTMYNPDRRRIELILSVEVLGDVSIGILPKRITDLFEVYAKRFCGLPRPRAIGMALFSDLREMHGPYPISQDMRELFDFSHDILKKIAADEYRQYEKYKLPMGDLSIATDISENPNEFYINLTTKKHAGEEDSMTAYYLRLLRECEDSWDNAEDAERAVQSLDTHIEYLAGMQNMRRLIAEEELAKIPALGALQKQSIEVP